MRRAPKGSALWTPGGLCPAPAGALAPDPEMLTHLCLACGRDGGLGTLPTAAILLTTPPKGGRAGRFHTAIHIKKHFCWSTDPQTAFSDRKPLAERRQRFPAGPLLHTIRSALHRTGMLLLHEPQRGRAFTNARNAERSDAKPKRRHQASLSPPRRSAYGIRRPWRRSNPATCASDLIP